MRLLKFGMLLFILLFSVSIMSQTLLRGKVTNNKGEAVNNTLVFLDTFKSDAVTNEHGYFRLKVPEGIKNITLYSPKYGFMSTPYYGEQKISFMFIDPFEENVEKKIVIGYGNEDKENLTSTVNTINIKDDKNASVFTDIYDYIRGRVAGVEVTSSNQILIRGVSTFNSSNEPLYVVDGAIVSSIDHIFPVEVDNISILKGSSASIYGSRGANGVVEITLKHQ